MPAQVELLNTVTKPAEIVYIDSNFLIDLMLYISMPDAPRQRACKDFYDKMIAKGTIMCTSYWCIQEAIWAKMKEEILLAIKAYEEDNNLQPKTISISKFKKLHQAEYKAAYENCKVKIERIAKSLLAMKLSILIPRNYKNREISKGERIVKYARALLMKYHGLEAADAFHIAIARCEGIKYIVSNDHYFQNVDEINVYAYSSASP